MITLLIVDDHPIVHDGIAAILRAERDIRIAGSASSVEQALTQIAAAAPDIVLLDLRLPGEDGLDGLTRMLQTHPSLRVIMFTAHDADEYVFAAIKAGAKGYVLKGSPGRELV